MKWLADVIVVVAAIKILALSFTSSLIGGDSFMDKVDNGHYFLDKHGHLKEVGVLMFNYHLWHARSVLITHPLGGLAGLWLWLRNRSSD